MSSLVEHVSYSSIAQFSNCPAQWALSKLYHAPQTDMDGPMKHGREVHEQIEWILRGVPTPEEELHFETKAALQVIEWFKGDTTIEQEHIEVSRSLPVPGREDVQFLGRVDLLLNGWVFDWKTSARGWEPGRERSAQQAVAYHWLFNMPVRFVVLEPNGEINLGHVREVQPNAKRIERYFSKVVAKIEAMDSGVYERKVGWGCRECPVLRTCKPYQNKDTPILAPQSVSGLGSTEQRSSQHESPPEPGESSALVQQDN